MDSWDDHVLTESEDWPESKLHIQLLLAGLEQHRRIPAMLLTYINAVVSGLLLIAATISAVLIAFNLVHTDLLAKVVLGTGVCLVMLIGVIAAWQALRLEEWQRTLPERIERAGLIEHLAAGPRGLPDIFEYTPFPWHLLGHCPRTLAQQARLLADNLDWYLLPEPRRYFRRVWVRFTWCAVLALGLTVAAEVLFPRSIYNNQSSIWIDPHWCAFTLVLALLLAPDWLAGFDLARRRIAAGVLASLIRERYGLQ